MKPRLQRLLQILEEIERELQVARQVLFGKLRGNIRQLLALLRRRSDQPRGKRSFGSGDSRDQQVPEVARQLAAEVLQVVPVALQLIHHFEHAAGIATGERLRDHVKRLERERSQQ